MVHWFILGIIFYFLYVLVLILGIFGFTKSMEYLKDKK